jgi:L-gulonate 3-dehydrogenase
MEAWRLVEDGVASPQDIDTAVSKGLGLRWSFMGPFETIDLNADGKKERHWFTNVL